MKAGTSSSFFLQHSSHCALLLPVPITSDAVEEDAVTTRKAVEGRVFDGRWTAGAEADAAAAKNRSKGCRSSASTLAWMWRTAMFERGSCGVCDPSSLWQRKRT